MVEVLQLRKALPVAVWLFFGLEDNRHVILGCGTTAALWMNFKCKQCLNYHEEIIVKKIINCNNFISRILKIIC
jgi:hypothetical protein